MKQMIIALVRKGPTHGLVAHLPNTWGRPLCKMNLKLKLWDLVEVEVGSVIICWHCRRIKAKGE